MAAQRAAGGAGGELVKYVIQAVLGDSMAVAVKEAKAEDASRHENHDVFFDDEDAPEPADRACARGEGAASAQRRSSLPGCAARPG